MQIVKLIVLQVQILMTCPICETSAVYKQRSRKMKVSDVSDVNKSKIFIILIDYKNKRVSYFND